MLDRPTSCIVLTYVVRMCAAVHVLLEYEGYRSPFLSLVLCTYVLHFSLLEEKVHELEKELYYYKKTSRDLKKRLRAHVQSAPRGQSDPSKGPLKANAAAQSTKGKELCGVSSGGEDRCVSQSQPQLIGCKEERGGGTATATASAQSDVLKVVRKSKKELRQLRRGMHACTSWLQGPLIAVTGMHVYIN